MKPTMGRPSISPKGGLTRSTFVAFPPADLEALKKEADDNCRTVSGQVRFIVREWLNHKELLK